jgi:hypothetical protein
MNYIHLVKMNLLVDLMHITCLVWHSFKIKVY